MPVKKDRHVVKVRRTPKKGPLLPLQRPVPRFSRTSTLTPPEVDVILCFNHQGTISNISGSQQNKYFVPNGAYDVDPALGSVDTLGFSEYAAKYDRFRVVKFAYQVEVMSYNDSTPMLITVVPMNDLITGISSMAAYAGNPYAKQKLISKAIGGEPGCFFKGAHRIADIAGTPEVEMDDKYAGGKTSNPSQLIHFYIGVDGVGNTLTNGVVYNVRFFLYTRFFERTGLSQ